MEKNSSKQCKNYGKQLELLKIISLSMEHKQLQKQIEQMPNQFEYIFRNLTLNHVEITVLVLDILTFFSWESDECMTSII